MHDTVGICYQNQSDLNQNDEEFAVNEPLSLNKRAKRKRSFEPIEGSLESYMKKPCITVFEYEQTDMEEPRNHDYIGKLDIAWMMSTVIVKDTLMGVGWNSLITRDPLPKQNVCYMENILCPPPTRHDVIVKTMVMPQKVAKKCNEDYASVHYDLAI